MDNQHRKISGYRDLTQEEIDLMNRAKALESEVLALHSEVESRLIEQTSKGTESGEWHRVNDSHAYRWIATGRTDIEKGFMALIRAVAQPQPR